ncbi:hypothetical protein [Burkholderia sp. BCC0397]|nr:hypothetical protein [Burkholderia sp. BCC0397]
MLFLAEMIASTSRLGHLFAVSSRSFSTVDMFFLLVLISLIDPDAHQHRR